MCQKSCVIFLTPLESELKCHLIWLHNSIHIDVQLWWSSIVKHVLRINVPTQIHMSTHRKRQGLVHTYSSLTTCPLKPIFRHLSFSLNALSNRTIRVKGPVLYGALIWFRHIVNTIALRGKILTTKSEKFHLLLSLKKISYLEPN